MYKTAIMVLSALSLFNPLFSQKEYRKTVIGVNTGCTVPYSDFAVKSIKPDAGFASPGMNAGIDFRYAGRFFGLSSTIDYASLFFSRKAYKSEYDRILSGYGQNKVSAGNYQILTGMLGFILKIPETNHFEALVDFQLGVAMSVHPNLAVTNSKLGVINTVSRNSDWDVASSIELEINYWITNKYGFGLDYSLNSTNPGFGDNTGIEKTFFLPVRFMNINLGFVMKM